MKISVSALLLLVVFLVPASAFAQLSSFCTIPSVSVCGASSMEYCISESQYEVCIYLYLNGQSPYDSLPPNETATGGGGTQPTYTGAPAVPSARHQQHAMDCANAYSQYSSLAIYTTSFQAVYGWGDKNDDTHIATTSTNAKPDTSHIWEPLDGTTDSANNITYVFANGYNTFENTVMTLAHEYAHQNGIGLENDDEAEDVAVSAIQAYRMNNGAWCPIDGGGNNSVDPASI